MAQVLDDAESRLFPPHFLSDVTAPLKMNTAAWKNTEIDAKLAFSRYDFPVDSVVNTESEEKDFFAELNRRLTLSESRKVTPLDLRRPSEVPKVSGGSPQSILGGIGSWSGRSSNGSHQSPLQGPSPPATPYNAEYDSAGLIYAAAGQVERLKMNTDGPLKASVNGQFRVVSKTMSAPHEASLLAEQNYIAAARHAYNAALLYEHHLQNLNNSARYTNPMPAVSSDLFSQSQWPPLQHAQPRVPLKSNFRPASLPRKESVGTGVFLPRRYNTSPAAPPRKRAVAANAIVPAKVVQALNMSFEEMNSRTQPHYSAYASSLSQKNCEALMGRRDAFLAQQQRRVARADDLAHSNLEVCLPQEWSY